MPKLLSRLVFAFLIIQLFGTNAALAKDLEVKLGVSHTFREFLNVHESPIRWISVGKKRYKRVMGRDPSYLTIPGRNTVLFVTTDSSQTQYTYHFVSLSDGREITITSSNDSLHHFIGFPELEMKFEIVEKDRVVIFSTTPKYYDTRWRRFDFDLLSRKVVVTWGN